MTRVSMKQLKDYIAVIKLDFDVDIRLMDNGRGVTMVEYVKFEGPMPLVYNAKSKMEALKVLKDRHNSLFGHERQ